MCVLSAELAGWLHSFSMLSDRLLVFPLECDRLVDVGKYWHFVCVSQGSTKLKRANCSWKLVWFGFVCFLFRPAAAGCLACVSFIQCDVGPIQTTLKSTDNEMQNRQRYSGTPESLAKAGLSKRLLQLGFAID